MLKLIIGIPRLPIRKRTPSEMLVLITDRLENAIINASIAQHTSAVILRSLVAVADSCLAWATAWKSDKSDEDILRTKVHYLVPSVRDQHG